MKLYNRAKEILPCGAQTLSKAPDRFPFGSYPIYMQRGAGSHVWDVDGNEYVDYIGALGPIILGHGYANEAIKNQLDSGILFSLGHPIEIEVAELLRDMIHTAEAVRFVKTGSSACEAAVRVARTYTGRERALSAGYHGWHGEFQAITEGRGKNGIPWLWTLGDGMVSIPYNNLSAVERELQIGNVAAVIIEPVLTEAPDPLYLPGLRDLCTKHGTVLIFDEVVTSFRWPGYTAQAYYNVYPDLTCLGKAMANGMPLSAVVGRKDIMQAFERCFVSGTYHGETLSLAAAQFTLNFIRKNDVIDHIWKYGKQLMYFFDTIMQQANLPGRAVGLGPVSRQQFETGEIERDNYLKSVWLEQTAKYGILFGNIQYPCFSHSGWDLTCTERTMTAAVGSVYEAYLGKDVLEGTPIKLDTFRR